MRAVVALLALAASGANAKCKDDKKWRYVRGPDGNTFAPKSCKDVAEKPDARCDRVSEDGVPARYACCQACADNDCKDASNPEGFLFVSPLMTWKQCKKACDKRGLSMPCITSQEKSDRLDDAPGGSIKWIGYTTGGKDPVVLSNWKWVNGCSSRFTPEDWGKGEPNNFLDKGEYCGQIWSGDWNDEVCNDPSESYSCYCESAKPDPCALESKSGGKAPSKGKCKKDDKKWRDKEDGTTCKGIKKIKDKKARKKACKKLKGENADGEIVTAKEACCKKTCK